MMMDEGGFGEGAISVRVEGRRIASAQLDVCFSIFVSNLLGAGAGAAPTAATFYYDVRVYGRI
jgi:hypothetical protein